MSWLAKRMVFPLAFGIANQAVKRLPPLYIESGGRFVQKDDVRVAHEGSGQDAAPLFGPVDSPAYCF